jgi:arylsulfatase A
MRGLSICLATAGTLTLLNGCSSCKDQATDLPNIILIMADDMGYETTGFNGGLSYKTPVLDRLASEGIKFTNCYSQPLSTPSRVKMMTGRYNYRNYEDFGYLNPNEFTFGNMMKNAGYNTCVVGKWQLNGLNRNNPGNQDVTRPYSFGFDEYCLWQLHHTPAEGERYANPLITQNGEDLPRDRDAYGPDIFSNFINDFIDKNVNEKFFIYYPMVLPHDPFVPTPQSEAWADSTKRYQQDDMYFRDMVEYIDLIIGRIEAKLKEKELWENTLLIFVADNGTSQRIVSKTISGDVKGAKGLSINAGNHVPLIAVWPKLIEKGRVCEHMISFADFLPTLAQITGMDTAMLNSDGKSFYPILKGSDEITQQEIFVHYSPRWGKFAHNRWVMDGKYKLYQNFSIYNTLQDPLEQHELDVLTPEEEIVRNRFEKIIKEKEEEFPFLLNDESFKLEYYD